MSIREMTPVANIDLNPTTLLIGVAAIGIVLSESALYAGSVAIALWGHFLVLLLCAFVPVRLRTVTSLCQVIALLPVFRIVNLGMPALFDAPLASIVPIYGVLLLAVLLVAGPWGATKVTVGWKLGLFSIPITIPIAFVLAEFEYALYQPDPFVGSWTGPQIVLFAVVMIGFVALVEELLFRGLVQGAFVDYLGRWSGITLASVLFAAMHSGHGVPELVAFAFVIGFAFGVLYDRTGSLLTVIVLHGFLNVFLFGFLAVHGSILGPFIA
ncbi:CPBP family intramembrane glutamic endopeptidase [Natronococcus pandeyae]|nr:type II CAAX endopeptidase family protein [Natronococcus pandeyae]